MEENQKPRSPARLAVALLFGAATGFFGALFGAITTTNRGIFSLSEEVTFTSAIGGPIVGACLAFSFWWFQPRRDSWLGGWGVLLLADLLGGGILSAVAFHVVARMMRA